MTLLKPRSGRVRFWRFWVFALFGLMAIPAQAIVIEYDYTYDSLGFFDSPDRRAVLELAAEHVNRYVDSLAAIQPNDERSWSIFPALPPSSSNKFISDLVVPEDTLKIMVGGNDVLPELTLAESNIYGPAPTSGGPEWEDILNTRGQAGAADSPLTDYGPWGGVIMLNTDFKWHFGLTTEGLDPDETDVLTVVMHELTHILGIGPSDIWQEMLQDDGGQLRFTGSEALSVGSLNNPQLNLNDGGHWQMATSSLVAGAAQEALMNPFIEDGNRRYPSLLERAALRDVGWQEAMPGDSDLDRDFDTGDIILVSQRAKYRTDQIATWADGDWNDDLVFDQNDLVSALEAGIYLTGPYAAVAPAGEQNDGQASVVYDANTGELAVDASRTAELSSINISSAAGIFTGDDGLYLDGQFDVDTDHDLFKATLGGGFSSISFGNVAMTGLEQAFLIDDLTVSGSLAAGGALGDVQLVYINAVPEPATVTLIMIGIAATISSWHSRRRFRVRPMNC